MSQITRTIPITEPTKGEHAKPGIPELNPVKGSYVPFEIGTPRRRTQWTVETAYLEAEIETRRSDEVSRGKSAFQLELGLGISGIAQITDLIQFPLPPKIGRLEEPRKAYLLDAFNGFIVPPGVSLILLVGVTLTPPIPEAELINYKFVLLNGTFTINMEQEFLGNLFQPRSSAAKR